MVNGNCHIGTSYNYIQSSYLNINRVMQPELQLDTANTSDTEAPFLIYICLFLTALLHPKFMINVMTLILT